MNSSLKILILLVILIIIMFFIFQYFNYDKFKIPMSPKLLEKDKKKLKDGQKIMTGMLKEFDKLCRRHNIKYWCYGGTLLGTVRHEGWIPWDGDIDIGMMHKDYLKLKSKIGELPRHMEFSEPQNKDCSKIRTNKAKYIYTDWGNNWDTDKGLQIDIFVFKEEKNILKFRYNESTRPYTVYPLRQHYFEGIKVYIPFQYKECLIHYYGKNFMEYPSKKDRYPHEGRFKLNKY